jgi:hypothetical protein
MTVKEMDSPWQRGGSFLFVNLSGEITVPSTGHAKGAVQLRRCAV